jgi:hypothetical protein
MRRCHACRGRPDTSFWPHRLHHAFSAQSTFFSGSLDQGARSIGRRRTSQSREIVLTIHWRGGQHSQLRVRNPRTGEHGCRTAEEAVAVIRSMSTKWSDEDIAATLNRIGLPTGQGKTWTAHRVSSLRRVRSIHAYKSAENPGGHPNSPTRGEVKLLHLICS